MVIPTSSTKNLLNKKILKNKTKLIFYYDIIDMLVLTDILKEAENLVELQFNCKPHCEFSFTTILLPTLKKLSVTNFPFSMLIFDFPCLEELSITSLGEEIVFDSLTAKKLSQLKYLNTLILRKVVVKPIFWTTFMNEGSSISPLKRLELGTASVTSETSDCILSFPDLKVLDIGTNASDIGDDALKKIAETLTKLETISINNVSHFGFSLFAKNCKKLTVLRAKRCKGVGDLTLKLLAENCEHLKELDVSNCDGVTDQGIVCIGSVSSVVKLCLEVLILSQCTALSSVAVKALSTCSKLKVLNCDGLFRLTDGGLITFALQAKKENKLSLQEFFLNSCYELTMLSIEELLKVFPKLCKVEVKGCTHFQNHDLHLISILIKNKFKTVEKITLKNSKQTNLSSKRKKKKIKPLINLDEVLNENVKFDPKLMIQQQKLNKKKKKEKKLLKKSKNS